MISVLIVETESSSCSSGMDVRKGRFYSGFAVLEDSFSPGSRYHLNYVRAVCSVAFRYSWLATDFEWPVIANGDTEEASA